MKAGTPSTSVCIAGKNRIAVEAAEFIQRQHPGLPLCVVANRTDEGHDTWQPSFRKWSAQNGVPLRTMDEVLPIEGLLFLSLEFDRLLKPAAFRTRNLINIHFSHLPEYKGMYTSVWPLLDGKDYSGVTLHRIDPGIDTGDIIAQRKIPLCPDTTARELYEAYLNTGLALVQEWFARLLSGDFRASPQPAAGSTYRSRRSLDFANLKVDLQQTAAAIHNQIRAFTFPEYQLPRVMGHCISRSEILPRRSTRPPGQVVNQTPAALEIATVDFDILCHKDAIEELIGACARADDAEARTHLDRMKHVEARNAKGWTPLMIAAYHSRPELVATLLDRGADPNAANYKGTSVSMYAKAGAIRSGQFECLSLLAARGADLRHCDHAGKNVLDYAREEGAAAVVAEIERLLLASA